MPALEDISLLLLALLFIINSLRLQSKHKFIDMAKEFNYKPQYGVIVICESEEDQIKMFEELKQKGLKLKVVTT
jgi:biotin synthase-like enzyme